MTTMTENGDSQKARFSFPAFRFIEQQNQSISTYYLHCITRLCEMSTCSQFKVWRGPAERECVCVCVCVCVCMCVCVYIYSCVCVCVLCVLCCVLCRDAAERECVCVCVCVCVCMCVCVGIY